MRLGELGMREIERFKAGKLKTHAKKTVNNYLTVLRKTLTTALDRGLLEQVPRLRWLATPAPSFRFLDFDEADRLVEAAELEPDWQTMIIVALRTGLRLGELMGLQWNDIDLFAVACSYSDPLRRSRCDTPTSRRQPA
jgi:integrase